MAGNKFDRLNYDEYFVRRTPPQAVDFEEGYWGESTDPDGVIRNIGEEREHKRELAATELSFINALTPGRVLDVGCGVGAILEGVNDSWEKHGLEVSQYAAEKAQPYGEIFCGELHQAKYPDGFFDAILLFHVIEHLQSPLEVLTEIRRILKVDGWLIVGTPDFDCGCARKYGDQFRLLHDITHITLFSSNSLFRMMTDLGFSVEKTEYPFFDTKYFTKENLLRLFDDQAVSPPFYGNIMTKYCRKLSKKECEERVEYLKTLIDRM